MGHTIYNNYMKIEFPEECYFNDAMTMVDKTAEVYKITRKKLNRLYDLRSNRVLDLNHHQMWTIVQKIRTLKTDDTVNKAAYVVTNHLQFGFLRMFQSMVEDVNIHVGIFFNEDDAINWLES